MEASEQNRITISPAGVQDMDAVFRLRLMARKTDPGFFPSSYEEELNRTSEDKQRWFNNPEQLIILAKTQHGAVGMVGAREKGAGVWYLHGVYVLPEFRGRHVAEQMMRTIVQKIREQPKANVITFQAEAENTPAIQLYKKYGFEVVGDDTAIMGDGKEHKKVVFHQTLEKIRL